MVSFFGVANAVLLAAPQLLFGAAELFGHGLHWASAFAVVVAATAGVAGQFPLLLGAAELLGHGLHWASAFATGATAVVALATDPGPQLLLGAADELGHGLH